MRNKRNNTKRTRHSGFTLIELMMVVMVVSILVTAAIPGISNAKKRANEATAITSMRTIASAQSQYRTRFGEFGSVTDLASSGMVNPEFSDAEKGGYDFVNASAPTPASWAMRANPSNPGVSGDRYFFVDTSGVIRYSDDGEASRDDSAIE